MQETIEGKVRIFISSTCYDLGQIRKDLDDFIYNQGYEPVLSESPKIAIPDYLNKIESCRWLVRTSNILILIIGGRYGNIDEKSNKSITWVEYEEGLASKIPIYIFIDREILEKRELYVQLKNMVKDNTLEEAKMLKSLGDKIKDIRVFELIDYIDTNEGGKWIFPFETASDIITRLKINLSLLFKNLLSIRSNNLRVTNYKNRPSLKILWQINDKSSETLELESPNKYSFPEIKELCKNAIVEDSLIDIIKTNKDKLTTIIENTYYEELGFSKNFYSFDSIIDEVNSFNYQAKLILKFDEDKFTKLSSFFDLENRFKKPDFHIFNGGDIPAEEGIIYLNIPYSIYLYNEDNIPNFYYERTKDINSILNIINDIGKFYDNAKKNEKIQTTNLPIIDSAQPWPSFISQPQNISNTFAETKIQNTIIEDGRIRINMSIKKLKHGFNYNEISNICFISIDREKGKIIDIPYICYADNLPQPDEGFLKIKLV